MQPKTKKRPYLGGFLINHKHIAWSDKRCHSLALAQIDAIGLQSLAPAMLMTIAKPYKKTLGFHLGAGMQQCMQDFRPEVGSRFKKFVCHRIVRHIFNIRQEFKYGQFGNSIGNRPVP